MLTINNPHIYSTDSGRSKLRFFPFNFPNLSHQHQIRFCVCAMCKTCRCCWTLKAVNSLRRRGCCVARGRAATRFGQGPRQHHPRYTRCRSHHRRTFCCNASDRSSTTVTKMRMITTRCVMIPSSNCLPDVCPRAIPRSRVNPPCAESGKSKSQNARCALLRFNALCARGKAQRAKKLRVR